MGLVGVGVKGLAVFALLGGVSGLPVSVWFDGVWLGIGVAVLGNVVSASCAHAPGANPMQSTKTSVPKSLVMTGAPKTRLDIGTRRKNPSSECIDMPGLSQEHLAAHHKFLPNFRRNSHDAAMVTD
jgi:hypothetical protein